MTITAVARTTDTALVPPTTQPDTARSDIDTEELFRGMAHHEVPVLEGLLNGSLDNLEDSGLDARAYALVNLAALVALGAPSASYEWQVGLALDAGVTPEDMLGLLVALNPAVGNVRIVAAATEVALALGIDLDEELNRL